MAKHKPSDFPLYSKRGEVAEAKPEVVAESPADSRELPVVPEPSAEIITELPRSPQPNKDRPLPQADAAPPSKFDDLLAENPSLEAMIAAQMKLRGVDAKVPRREFFELLMWEWTFGDSLKKSELGARILGRAYLGEGTEEKTSEKLTIEGYEDGVQSMMSRPAQAGKKRKS